MKKICFIFIVLIQNYQAQINLNSSLTACYALNGNAYEAINALHGTISNAMPAPNRFNSANSAYSFNGNVNTFIELPSNSLIKPNALTFSAWIKPNLGFYNTSYVLFTRNSAANTNSMSAYALSLEDLPSGKRFRVTKGNPSNSVFVDNTSLISLNAWYHVCFTIDTVIKIYLNGVLENTVTANIPFDYGFGKRVYLGASNEPNDTHPFMGSIDNVRFYNRILSAQEINQVFLNDPACLTTTAAPVASFTLTSPACAFQPITFFDNSSNAPSSWKWQINGPLSYASISNNPTFTFTPGTYTATLVSTNAVGSGTITIPFVVNPLPVLSIVATKTLICRHMDSSTLTAFGASTYTWYATPFQVGQPIVVSPVTTTTYVVMATDTMGCVNSNSLVLRVLICEIGGVKENVGQNLIVRVYPNPGNGKYFIEASLESEGKYTVFDVNGKVILNGSINFSTTKELDLSNQAKGIYLLQVSTDKGNRTIRLIKE